MMRHELVVKLLRSVSYRPEWTITAHRHPFGTYVLIDAEVIDAERYDQKLSVAENYAAGNTTRVGVRACVPQFRDGDEDDQVVGFFNWLAERLIKVERHESREFFMVSGVPWDSPHKRPQPKHDYHVRKSRKYGDWRVWRDAQYPKGMPEPGQFSTMPEAYEHALWLVVQDDLGKPIDKEVNG